MAEQLLITKEMMIGDVVQKYPHAAEVFTEYGLHCVGCHISPMETVEQGAKGHGMDDETMEKMITDANKAAKEAPKKEVKTVENPELVFTEKAVAKIKEIAEKEEKADGYFRIGVMPGGCSGFSYFMNFEDDKTADDVEMDKDGLKVLVDKQSLQLLQGANVDFVETLQESGFKIDNPNAKKSCGCGSSFG